MPPASPGRYQSRLFNFLNRQALRLTDQFERTARHIKVAAVWGTQILLYPIYLFVEGGLSVGRQLAAEAESGWPKLKELTDKEHQEPPKTPPAVDTPLQRVLSEVNTLQLPELSALVLLQAGRLVQTTNQEAIEKKQATQRGELACTSTGEVVQHQNLSEDALSGKQTSNKGDVIQGVASLLATRSLVLVTVENQILDILTPQQQQKLASKIRWEVADLLHQRRLAQSLQIKKATPRLAALDRPGVFLPVRLFWQVMAWVQTSPVAIAANLFQEATFIGDELPVSYQILTPRPALDSLPQLPASNDSVIANPVGQQKAIAFLDHAIAQLESHPLVPGAESLILLRDSLRDKLNSSPLAKGSIQNPKESLATSPSVNKIQTFIRNLIPSSQSSAPTTEASQKHSLQIQALIYAAVDYFFGRRGSSLPGTDAQDYSQTLANSQGTAQQLSGRHSPSLWLTPSRKDLELADAGESDPWLSWSDLFGNSDIPYPIPQSSYFSQDIEQNNPSPHSQSQLPEAFDSKMPVKLGNSVRDVLKRFLRLKPSPDNCAPITKTPTVESQLTVAQKVGKLKTTQKIPPLVTHKRNKGSISKQGKTSSSVATSFRNSKGISPAGKVNTSITPPSSSSQDTNLEPAPDWIETQATPTGYVKHPLERVLEWLDIAMLWLEEVVVKVWQWLWRRRH